MKYGAIFLIEISLRTLIVALTSSTVVSADQKKLKELPIGVISIETIINGGYVYVDKTSFILKLLEKTEKFIFLSRPKLFGRTLLIDTMETIFKGKSKDIFNDTAIGRSEYEWLEYPVIRINFARIPRNFPTEFFDSARKEIRNVGRSYGLTDLRTPNITDYFVNVTRTLHEKFGKPVVVLIEESDWTFSDQCVPPRGATIIRERMQHFYKAIQLENDKIKLCFVTTVTELPNGGNFSGYLDIGLEDISAEPDYAQIAGFTGEEIRKHFDGHINDISKHEKMTRESIYNEIWTWYTGHQFSSDPVLVHCPHSVLTYLKFNREHDAFGYKWGINITSISQPPWRRKKPHERT